MKTVIKKAVFPVAGLGTRFLPATKANPKEMLPIVDKPVIQYAVEEAIEAGIEELIFVTSSAKRAIEDHFDANFELEYRLKQQEKYKELKTIQNIVPEGIRCVYIRQPEALGLGHAIYCAKTVVGNQPFAVLLADDLMQATPGALKQLITHHEQTNEYAVAVTQIPREKTNQYGIVAHDAAGRITQIVEKPNPDVAPSTLGVIGRYLLPASVFNVLENLSPGAGQEIQLTDALAQLIKTHPFNAFSVNGQRYDCGSKIGYLKATVSYGLQHPETRAAFKQWLQHYLAEHHTA